MTAVLRYAAITARGQGGNPETTFLTPTGRSVRFAMCYFRPRAEVSCGYATIASAVALAEHTTSGSITLHALAGPVTSPQLGPRASPQAYNNKEAQPA